MRKTTSFLIALFIVAAVSAQWGKRIKGDGNIVTKERSIGDYDAIAVSGWFDVNLVGGTEGHITLEGEGNLLEYIKTEVRNGKLTIKVEKGVQLRPSNWNGGIIITVPVESIESVSLSGSGDIVSNKTIKANDFNTSISGSGDINLSVDANSVTASMSGSGDINLSGNTSDLNINVSGSGDIQTYKLEADFVTVQVSGSADVSVTANQMLKARVSGSGDISYRGNPAKVDTKVSGSGDITEK